MIRSTIPTVEGVRDEPTSKILSSVKSIIESITGRNQAQIKTLGADATLSGVINKVNEIIERLQS